jgi:hypothetical protein
MPRKLTLEHDDPGKIEAMREFALTMGFTVHDSNKGPQLHNDCYTCRHDDGAIYEEPCKSCVHVNSIRNDYNHWEK